MLKTSIVALFILSMATLTMSASSLPVPTDHHSGTALEVADLD